MRKDFKSWDDTFMVMALVMSERSKDPITQVGSIIVDKNNKIIGTGYNGLPKGVSQNSVNWETKDDMDWLEKKSPYMVHAEINAILNKNDSAEGGRIYCTLFPCNECAKAIIQVGIKEVIFLDAKYIKKDYSVAALRLFALAGIKVRHYKLNK